MNRAPTETPTMSAAGGPSVFIGSTARAKGSKEVGFLFFFSVFFFFFFTQKKKSRNSRGDEGFLDHIEIAEILIQMASQGVNTRETMFIASTARCQVQIRVSRMSPVCDLVMA